MAAEPTQSPARQPVPRAGRIRRCRVRHVSIVPAPGGATVQVDCLLGGSDHPLPLGTMDEARPICNACTARRIWPDDDE
jgi:hypothetical protein